MKRALAMLLAVMMVVLLAACEGNNDLEATNSGTLQQEENPSSDLQQNSTLTVLRNSSTLQFKTEYIPVASSQGSFIVRNESGSLYGLVDKQGAWILPCEYEEISFCKGKNQTVLKVMSKGSYGVFDLNGNERIPCVYTEINFSSYSDFCVVKTFAEKLGVLDFNGNTILPIEFDVVKFGYGKAIAAAKNSNEQSAAVVAAYSPRGELIKEFPWDKGEILDIVVGNGGNLLSVNYQEGTNRIGLAYLTTEGEAVWGDVAVVGNHTFYFQGNELMARDMDTLQDVVVWSFPEGQDSKQSDIRSTSSNIDPISGVESVDLCVAGVMDDAPQGEIYYIRITFGEQIDTISYKGSDIVNTMNLGDWNNVGDFYDGTAIVFPQSGYLYTINTKGEKISEIKKPYTNRKASIILPYAAILNNNGFYTIVNSKGEELLSKNGYSSVQSTEGGIYLVTDQNGKLGLINEYAEELVPCGGIDSIETAIQLPANDEWKLEACYETEDELYVVYNEDKWAIYSTTKRQLLTDFMEETGENAWEYDCVLGNGGYALINDEADTIYLVSYDGSSYKVFLYFDLLSIT